MERDDGSLIKKGDNILLPTFWAEASVDTYSLRSVITSPVLILST